MKMISPSLSHKRYVQWSESQDSAKVAFTPSHLSSSFEFVESFSLFDYHISVHFSSTPLRSASIFLQSLSSGCSPPSHVHFSPSYKPKEWSVSARNVSFTETSTNNFEAKLDLTASEPVIGISFVIALPNDQWIRSLDGSDLYVGHGPRDTACAVEFSLPLPTSTIPLPVAAFSLYRINPFWLFPKLSATLQEMREETVFALYQLTDSRYVALLPMINPERGIRASLFGRNKYVGIRLETGRSKPLRQEDVERLPVCVAGIANEPYMAVMQCVKKAQGIVPEFCSRLQKLQSARWKEISTASMLNKMGFCTWDAFGHEVDVRKVKRALNWMKGEGVRVGYAIVDDGWQGGGGDGPEAEDDGLGGRPRMSSFSANEKFDGTLKGLEEPGLDIVAWAAIIGYWGGVSGTKCDMETYSSMGTLSRGLKENDRMAKIDADKATRWERTFEVVGPEEEKVRKFFERYFLHSMAGRQGVTGVKVDAQSLPEILCNKINGDDTTRVSRSSLTKAYRSAMTAAVETAFPSTVVINCMACGPETVMLSGKELTRANVCWRTSNDHAFPGVEENEGAVAWHILCNAYNSIYLGEIFPVVDWDMFRAGDEHLAKIHAIARVVSGGPIYISDAMPIRNAEFTKDLLRNLTTNSGRILRCSGPGRPTKDSLFRDPREAPGCIFKIFNRSTVLGILGMFNLNSTSEGQLEGSFCPSDVQDFIQGAPLQKCEYISLVNGGNMNAFHHRSVDDKAQICIPPMCGQLAHICPVFDLGSMFKFGDNNKESNSNGGEIQFAILGQPRMFNCGGCVASLTFSKASAIRNDRSKSDVICVHCELEDYGETFVWLSLSARKRLGRITSFYGETLTSRDIIVNKVPFVAVSVANRAPVTATLHFQV